MLALITPKQQELGNLGMGAQAALLPCTVDGGVVLCMFLANRLNS